MHTWREDLGGGGAGASSIRELLPAFIGARGPLVASTSRAAGAFESDAAGSLLSPLASSCMNRMSVP